MLSRGVSLAVLSWVLAAVSLIIVALRFLARCIRLGRLEADDYCMSLAMLTELAHTSILTVAQHYGMGKHIWNLTRTARISAMKYIMVLEGLTVASSMFGRISFAIFLLMVLGPTAWIKRYILYGIVGVQAVINVITIVQIYAQCGRHPAALWNPEVSATAHCQSVDVETMIAYVQSALNSFCDLLLTILPTIIVWELDLPRKVKIGLCMALGLSVFALIASIVKATEIKNLSFRNDLTYNMVSLQFCAVVENNVVIIAASIPKLRPLWRRHTTHYLESNLDLSSRTVGTPRPQLKPHSLPMAYNPKHETQCTEDQSEDDGNKYSTFEQTGDDVITKTVDIETANRNASASSSTQDDTTNMSNGQKYSILEFLNRSSHLSMTL